jgi:hypothetical protein
MKPFKRLHCNGRLRALPANTEEVTENDKHSSLLRCGINYESKKFVIKACVKVLKLSFPNKLECLSLTVSFSQV